jgi:hypothetical protein
LDVKVATLDEIAAGRPVALIKIDVEGFEAEVMAGATETVSRWHPPLLLEIEARHLGGVAAVTATIDDVVALGYDGYGLRREGLLPVGEFDVVSHQLSAQDEHGIPRGRTYVNNFIFLPAGTPVSGLAGALSRV